MTQASALVAYNTSELLTLRHKSRLKYQIITQACTRRLQALGYIAPSAVIDKRYLVSELEGFGISTVVLARYELPQILGLVGARIDRMGARFCLRVQRPYFAEHSTFYGVQRYEIYEALKLGCLRYVLQHLILFRLDDAPPAREVEWHIAGMKCGDRYRLRGTELVRI